MNKQTKEELASEFPGAEQQPCFVYEYDPSDCINWGSSDCPLSPGFENVKCEMTDNDLYKCTYGYAMSLARERKYDDI